MLIYIVGVKSRDLNRNKKNQFSNGKLLIILNRDFDFENKIRNETLLKYLKSHYMYRSF